MGILYLDLLLIIIGISALLGENKIDKIGTFFYLMFIFGFFFTLGEALTKIVTRKDYNLWMIFFIFTFFIIINFRQVKNFTTFVVCSKIITLNYDLETEEFKNNKKIKIATPEGRCIIAKENGLYRIYLPRKIVDVNLFYTSYDANGIHKGRILWIKDVDFTFKDRYIESYHVLNESANNGKGRHLIKYYYRLNIFELLKKSSSFWRSYLE
ncbi:MAG: hypothetical protein AB1755_00300 [Candidatus Omnitrophota bacterium]